MSVVRGIQGKEIELRDLNGIDQVSRSRLSPDYNQEQGNHNRSAPEQMVDQTIETPVIWDAITLIMMSL